MFHSPGGSPTYPDRRDGQSRTIPARLRPSGTGSLESLISAGPASQDLVVGEWVTSVTRGELLAWRWGITRVCLHVACVLHANMIFVSFGLSSFWTRPIFLLVSGVGSTGTPSILLLERLQAGQLATMEVPRHQNKAILIQYVPQIPQDSQEWDIE